MLRGVIPSSLLMKHAKQNSSQLMMGVNKMQKPSITVKCGSWYEIVVESCHCLATHELEHLSWERQVGFLHLLEQAIRLIGFGMTAHVEVLVKIVTLVLSGSQSLKWRKSGFFGGVEVEVIDEGEEDVEEVEEGGDMADVVDEEVDAADRTEEVESQDRAKLRDANQSSKVRNMALVRLEGKK